MIFSNEILDLGKREISSVRANANGNLDFVFREQSRLVYSELLLTETPPSLTPMQTISYANDCFILDKGIIHRTGTSEYIKKEQTE